MAHPVRIIVKPRGPYLIEGGAAILDADGRPVPIPPGKDPARIKLCGCGRSLTWPYCDGAHKLASGPSVPPLNP